MPPTASPASGVADIAPRGATLAYQQPLEDRVDQARCPTSSGSACGPKTRPVGTGHGVDDFAVVGPISQLTACDPRSEGRLEGGAHRFDHALTEPVKEFGVICLLQEHRRHESPAMTVDPLLLDLDQRDQVRTDRSAPSLRKGRFQPVDHGGNQCSLGGIAQIDRWFGHPGGDRDLVHGHGLVAPGCERPFGGIEDEDLGSGVAWAAPGGPLLWRVVCGDAASRQGRKLFPFLYS
jgi:hypothetical protein